MALLPLLLVLFVALVACGEASAPHSGQDAASQLAVPAELTEAARQGEALFNTNCAQCHGQAAAGTNLGPTFIDRIYHPGHHGDAAFHLAVLRGVRAHHWNFGNMLPVPGVTETEVSQIICYVRHLQLTAGVFKPTEYQPTC